MQQLEDLNNYAKELETKISSASNLAELDKIRVLALGKSGKLTVQLKQLGQLPKELRPQAGQHINKLKAKLHTLISQKHEMLQKQALENKLASEKIDITLPGRLDDIGSKHPVTKVMQDLISFFRNKGFDLATGPEIEADYYNFQALNIPEHHPARASQDTFYFNANTLLRTHTSGVQVRVMEETKAPIRVIAPGRVYRCDADVTHTPMFHQIEGLWVDDKVSFADLKGVLMQFLHYFFGKDVVIRFRPSYFPFTEPSAEVDIGYKYDKGSDIKWLEILGCGMVHPNVLKSAGVDTSKYRGFAFGLGLERMAMLKYKISDIRSLFENDQRFLKQFVSL